MASSTTEAAPTAQSARSFKNTPRKLKAIPEKKMPLRTFECRCGTSWRRIVQGEGPQACPKCGTEVTFQLPTEFDTTVYETRDRYRGTKVRKGQEQAMRKRMHAHHDKYEIAEKIDKHGLDEAKRAGWLKKAKKI
jgi:hypothetical protein